MRRLWRYYVVAVVAFYLGGVCVTGYLVNAFSHGISVEDLPYILWWPWVVVHDTWFR
jgi:hypothetical protein